MGQTIKVSTAKAVEVLPFHQDVLRIALAGRKATETMAQKMQALLVSRYGAPVIGTAADGSEMRSGGPTFEQFKADRRALAQLAKAKGLASDQWVRKPFCAALHVLYGGLPEAQTPEALRKATERKIAADAIKAAREKAAQSIVTAGAPKGETQDRQSTEAEQVESVVTRIGVLKCLDACLHILEADDSTKTQAVHMRKMAQKAAQIIAQANAPKAEGAKEAAAA